MAQPSRISTLDLEGVSVVIDRAGRGQPLLCLTALGHDAGDYGALADLIGDRFELLRVEWPGHGRSGPDPMPASAQRYAELLERLVPALGLEPPLVIGNSIGGAAALLYARSHPVQGLVLCNSGGLVEVTPAVARFCRLFARFFAAGARGAWWYRPAFALYYRLVLPTPSAAVQRRRIVAACRRIAPVLRQGWESFGRPEADLREVAAALDVPVWIAWADRDRVIPLRRCLPAIRRMPRAQLSRFKAGHVAFLEQPRAFAGGLEAFVAGLRP